MCLSLNKKTRVRMDKDGNYIGYKILILTHFNTLLTPFRGVDWTWGVRNSSRSNPTLQMGESLHVVMGIHLYSKLKDAIGAADEGLGLDPYGSGRRVVVRVTVKPGHFVASGTFDDCEDSFVATKVESYEKDIVYRNFKE